MSLVGKTINPDKKCSGFCSPETCDCGALQFPRISVDIREVWRADADPPTRIRKGEAEELNCQLAEMFGWTNIVSTGGSLLGRPPGGSPRSRDQGMIPHWSADLKEATRLMVLTHSYVDGADVSREQFLADKAGFFLDDEQAFCFAVCRKVLQRLKKNHVTKNELSACAKI